MLIIKVKRINSNIKIMVVAEDETDKTRVLEYGADEFAVKPISAETVVVNVYSLLLTKSLSRMQFKGKIVASSAISDCIFRCDHIELL